MRIVILGLTLSSSWGNGHATTYRGLVRELAGLGHQVIFLERDVPWYADHRDLPEPDFCRLHFYSDLSELKNLYTCLLDQADLTIVGSYVPEGVGVGEWVIGAARGLTAFYDIDTPVTLSKLQHRDYEYLAPHLIPSFDLYLSSTGGPILEYIETELGSPMARPFYCSVDPMFYYPEKTEKEFDLGYLGTYSADRQAPLEQLLLHPARIWESGRFIVAGPRFPREIQWPANVRRLDHLAPGDHRRFYNAQRFTLNLTRADMVKTGYAPSVRLFEAAACGTPIISDYWTGLEDFFEIGREILISRSAEQTLSYLTEMKEPEYRLIGEKARARILKQHTAAHRAQELEAFVEDRNRVAGQTRRNGPRND